MWRWVSIYLLPLVEPVVYLPWHKVAGGLLDVGLQIWPLSSHFSTVRGP